MSLFESNEDYLKERVNTYERVIDELKVMRQENVIQRELAYRSLFDVNIHDDSVEQNLNYFKRSLKLETFDFNIREIQRIIRLQEEILEKYYIRLAAVRDENNSKKRRLNDNNLDLVNGAASDNVKH